jgi:hypothetical protein
MYSASFDEASTQNLVSQSMPNINTILYPEFDLNQDNLIDWNDQNILWKYTIRKKRGDSEFTDKKEVFRFFLKHYCFVS